MQYLSWRPPSYTELSRCHGCSIVLGCRSDCIRPSVRSQEVLVMATKQVAEHTVARASRRSARASGFVLFSHLTECGGHVWYTSATNASNEMPVRLSLRSGSPRDLCGWGPCAANELWPLFQLISNPLTCEVIVGSSFFL